VSNAISMSDDITSETETANPSGAPEFTPVYSEVRVDRYLVLCVVFCRSQFVPFSVDHYVVCPLIYGV
jgi:hypothetical protein